MMIYKELTPTEATIEKGRRAKNVREAHGKTVDEWIGMLKDHVDIDLTAEHIANIEAGAADLATASEWALRDAEEYGLIKRTGR